MNSLTKDAISAILIRMPLPALGKFCALNSKFAALCNSEEFWSLKYANDFTEPRPKWSPAKQSYFSCLRWHEFKKEKSALFDFMLPRVAVQDQQKFKDAFPKFVENLYDETDFDNDYYYSLVTDFLDQTNIEINGTRADYFMFTDPDQRYDQMVRFTREAETIGNFMLASIEKVDTNPLIVGPLQQTTFNCPEVEFTEQDLLDCISKLSL